MRSLGAELAVACARREQPAHEFERSSTIDSADGAADTVSLPPPSGVAAQPSLRHTGTGVSTVSLNDTPAERGTTVVSHLNEVEFLHVTSALLRLEVRAAPACDQLRACMTVSCRRSGRTGASHGS
jgi:hypothetical protein